MRRHITNTDADIDLLFQYPLNLMNIASVQDFNALVPKDADLKKVDILRFRPNIISM